MITVTATQDISKLRTFPAFIDRNLSVIAEKAGEEGVLKMQGHMPKGTSLRLHDSAESDVGHTSNRHTAFIFSNPSIAPYNQDVDQGTGVDGPRRRPVVTDKKMSFRDSRNGRTVVTYITKARPSLKIEAGKGYNRKTFDDMNDFARRETLSLFNRIPTHFRAVRTV